MRALVLGGAGGMGQGVARDLIKQQQVTKVIQVQKVILEQLVKQVQQAIKAIQVPKATKVIKVLKGLKEPKEHLENPPKFIFFLLIF